MGDQKGISTRRKSKRLAEKLRETTEEPASVETDPALSSTFDLSVSVDLSPARDGAFSLDSNEVSSDDSIALATPLALVQTKRKRKPTAKPKAKAKVLSKRAARSGEPVDLDSDSADCNAPHPAKKPHIPQMSRCTAQYPFVPFDPILLQNFEDVALYQHEFKKKNLATKTHAISLQMGARL
ncbi:hypothetical protein B0H13DRAFT_1872783 [Mycena leptocephala]|nr:hypothetical protein B0H13DRAFT_1872783 [Mycena leptocephala]